MDKQKRKKSGPKPGFTMGEEHKRKISATRTLTGDLAEKARAGLAEVPILRAKLAEYETALEELREESQSGYLSIKEMGNKLLVLVDEVAKLGKRVAEIEAADDARIEAKIQRLPEATLRRLAQPVFRPTRSPEREDKSMRDDIGAEAPKDLSGQWEKVCGDLKPIKEN